MLPAQPSPMPETRDSNGVDAVLTSTPRHDAILDHHIEGPRKFVFAKIVLVCRRRSIGMILTSSASGSEPPRDRAARATNV